MTDKELAKRIYYSIVEFGVYEINIAISGKYSLVELFSWGRTVEGYDFWEKVFRNKLRTAKELQQFMLIYYYKKGFIDLNNVI